MILDTSVIIASLRGERGAIDLDSRLDGMRVSVVNLTEVFHAARRRNVETTPEEIEETLVAAGVEIVTPTRDTARFAAAFMSAEPPKGYSRISLGDGFCLAHAFEYGEPALTGDRAWTAIPLPFPVKIELIR
ncbi:MAG: PIN domain-containing protein [Parvularculaceae bacterium]